MASPLPGLRRSVIGRWYAALPRRAQTALEITVVTLGPVLLGLAIYLPLADRAPRALETLYWIYFAANAATALMIAMEIGRAHRFPEPPLRDPVDDADLPRVAALVAAYLPNEQETIWECLRAHLDVDYPADRHVVVLAYNTPEPLAAQERLEEWAAREPRLLVVQVVGSTSKAENLNAAVGLIADEVDVIGIFDADHQPHPSAPRRVAQWLADAAGDRRFDMVQGQCVVRNLEENGLTRLVGAEFATMYAVAHPGRTVVSDFGIFGGSNGWWRAPVLRELGVDGDKLTEDIDLTARALVGGHRLGTDPRIVSGELAPHTWWALWRQRMRWSQGWLQVSLAHLVPMLRSPQLSPIQRRGVALLFGWRILHPWLATQTLPLVVALALSPQHTVKWFLLFFVMSALIVNGVPILQAAAANRLAPPGIGRRPLLFARFAVLSLLFYAEFKMTVNRASVLRELFGLRTWDVTARRAPVVEPVLVPALVLSQEAS